MTLLGFAGACLASSCHGIAGRCLAFAAWPMPACARCIGVYSGMGVVGVWWLAHLALGRAAWLPARWWRPAAGAVAACLIDGLTHATDLAALPNASRFFLGYAAGLALAAGAAALLGEHMREARGPTFADSGPAWLLAAAPLPALALALPGSATTGAALTALAAIGWLLFRALLPVVALVAMRRAIAGRRVRPRLAPLDLPDRCPTSEPRSSVDERLSPGSSASPTCRITRDPAGLRARARVPVLARDGFSAGTRAT